MLQNHVSVRKSYRFEGRPVRFMKRNSLRAARKHLQFRGFSRIQRCGWRRGKRSGKQHLCSPSSQAFPGMLRGTSDLANPCFYLSLPPTKPTPGDVAWSPLNICRMPFALSLQSWIRARRQQGHLAVGSAHGRQDPCSIIQERVKTIPFPLGAGA